MKRFILVSVAGLLSACGGASLDDVGVTMTGSFSKDTATRAGRSPECYFQTRAGNWAGFATAYTFKRVSKQVTYQGTGCYGTGCIKTATDKGGIGKFAVGFDPDTTIDFKTTDVIRRWGDGAGLKNGLFYSVTDTGERRDSRITLRFTPRNRDVPRYFPVTVKYQFGNGEPLLDRNTLASAPYIDAPEVDLIYSHTNPPAASSTANAFTEKLYAFLFNSPQPTSLLTIEVSDENGGVIFRGTIDFRDARQVLNSSYAQWVAMVERGCAKL